MRKPALTIEALRREEAEFAEIESTYPEPSLYGVDNGKTVGTYLEHKFTGHLSSKYEVLVGSSASGIDLPELGIDIKVTSVTQPQSSCPFRDGRQKIFGLGYSLIVFVYSKSDDRPTETATLDIRHAVFVAKEQTADYQTTKSLQRIIANGGNADDIVAYFSDHAFPLDDIEAQTIADELLAGAELTQGYLTVSNARQWRLQYGHALKQAGKVEGIFRVR